jgi:hypothetical protein
MIHEGGSDAGEVADVGHTGDAWDAGEDDSLNPALGRRPRSFRTPFELIQLHAPSEVQTTPHGQPLPPGAQLV